MSAITKRESEILILISKGLSVKEIASELNVSAETIKTHRKNLLRKFHVKNSPQLIKMAFQPGDL
jgi:DNA-binding NarL/FixJ family response regulator